MFKLLKKHKKFKLYNIFNKRRFTINNKYMIFKHDFYLNKNYK